MKTYRYAIIGSSAAGISGLEGIRKVDSSGSIIIISDEMNPTYSRSLISYFLAGQIDEEGMLFRPRSFYGKEGVTALIGRKVLRLHPQEREMVLDDGETIGYERLLLATGSRAYVPMVKGAELLGCHVLHTYDDARSIKGQLNGAKEAIVVGGGPIGIKAAEALVTKGLQVTLVVSSDHLLSQILDAKTSSIVHSMMGSNGVKILTEMDITEVLGGSKVEGAVLSDGRKVDCQMIIFCKGVRANIELAKECGIKVNKGILVDDHLETSIPGIFAAGDVAEVTDILTGERTIHSLWPNAMQEGDLAGINMAGGNESFRGSFGMNSMNIFGNQVIVMGLMRPEASGNAEVSSAEGDGWYRSLAFRDSRIIGAVLIGDIDNAGVINYLIVNKISIEGLKEAALRPDFDIALLAEAGIEIKLED